MANPFFDVSIHRRILTLAIPMVISNITVPLLGLVDTAVIGHLDHAWFLGGVALGSTVISLSFWLLGFLRMSTTGLAAQALGQSHKAQVAMVFVQGVICALGLSVLMLLCQSWLIDSVLSMSQASEQVQRYAREYFFVRVWSAPAALMNFVILGWLLGNQNSRLPMVLVIVSNVVNIALDMLFVLGFEWQVKGVAAASVLADYLAMLLGLSFVYRQWVRQQLPALSNLWRTSLQGMGRLLALNRDIFIRSLCLQCTLFFITFQGANYGDDVVAANAILMSFVMVISYAMDGIAYALEALVGHSMGAKDRTQLKLDILGAIFWGALVCALLSSGFYLAKPWLIAAMSSIETVQAQAALYWPWLVAMPMVSVWCYLFDGIFVGATKAKSMRNSMILATVSFVLVFFATQTWQNHSLWLAFSVFMLCRGLSLGYVLWSQWRRGVFLLRES